jgi:hypothetical protein
MRGDFTCVKMWLQAFYKFPVHGECSKIAGLMHIFVHMKVQNPLLVSDKD